MTQCYVNTSRGHSASHLREMGERAGVEMPPADVVARGMQDMDAGARRSVQLACDSWRAGRLEQADVEEMLRSFAWQSPTLKDWFDVVGTKRQKTPETHPEQELLSLEDMAALMEGAQEGAAKRPRRCGSHTAPASPCCAASREPAVNESEARRGAALGSGMRKSVSMARFEQLALDVPAAEADEEWDLRASGLTATLGRVSLGAGLTRGLLPEPATAKTAAVPHKLRSAFSMPLLGASLPGCFQE